MVTTNSSRLVVPAVQLVISRHSRPEPISGRHDVGGIEAQLTSVEQQVGEQLIRLGVVRPDVDRRAPTEVTTPSSPLACAVRRHEILHQTVDIVVVTELDQPVDAHEHRRNDALFDPWQHEEVDLVADLDPVGEP